MARVRPRCFQHADHLSSSTTKLCSDARFMTASHAKSRVTLSSFWQDMFIDDATLIRAPSLLLFQFLHPLLQGLHHAPQNHRQLLVIQGQQLLLPAHGLAQGLAQLPGGLHVLGDEAELVLGSTDAVVVLRFHFIEEPLDVLLRRTPDVRLEPPVRGVQVCQISILPLWKGNEKNLLKLRFCRHVQNQKVAVQAHVRFGRWSFRTGHFAKQTPLEYC